MAVTTYSNATADYYFGDGANDHISSSPKWFDDKPNYMDGGAGNDSMFGSYGWDYMYGGSGNDFLSDVCLGILHGDDGDDYLDISSGGGYLYGDAGNDTLTSGSGESTLSGGAGNDTFVFTRSQNYGSCAIDGGDAAHAGYDAGQPNHHGVDRIEAYGDGVVIGLKSIARIDSIVGNGSGITIETANTATYLDFSNTTLTGIAQINGLDGDDTIIGSSGSDTIFGGWSTGDSLFGGDGNDYLIGYGGELTGGAGSDVFRSVGSMIVNDFSESQGDRIFIQNGWTCQYGAYGGGTGLLFSANGVPQSQMVLAGVAPGDVKASWFVVG
ncbi:calcium-binding protein [Azospirillum argentinense]